MSWKKSGTRDNKQEEINDNHAFDTVVNKEGNNEFTISEV
jgi:hypothetical protein